MLTRDWRLTPIMCCWIKDPSIAISLDAETTLDGRRNGPEDHGTSQGYEWAHAHSDGSMLGKPVGTPGSS